MLLAAKPELVDTGHLHVAGFLEVVEHLLHAKPKLKEMADLKGRLALHVAAEHCRRDVFLRLLPNSSITQVSLEGENILHFAVYDPVMLGMALALYPELVHEVDNSGNTVLHSLCLCWDCCESEADQLLLALFLERIYHMKPAALRARNENDVTPFMRAIRKDSLWAIEFFVLGRLGTKSWRAMIPRVCEPRLNSLL